MELFPNPQTVIQIGPLSIQWYAVLILAGAFAVLHFMKKAFAKMGYDAEVADDLFTGGILLGVIGARIWYVLFSDFGAYLQDPISMLNIREGGLAIQGGLFGGMLFGYYYCRKHKMSFLRIFDVIAPYVLIAQAIGRWGNFINKEAFGEKVTEAYFQHWPSFLNFIKEGMFVSGSYREPMFFYESILCIIGFVLILLYRHFSKPKRGDMVYCYLLWYGAIRFWIEARRSDSLMFMGLKMAQLVSIAFIVIGLLGLLGFIRKWMKKTKPIILFDLDGTLLDTEEVIFASYKHVFSKYKPELEITEEQMLEFLGPPLSESMAKHLPEFDVEELIDCYRKFNIENHKKYVKAFPYAKECIVKLKEEGYTLGIVSTKFKDVIELGLECCKMEGYFDVILGLHEYENNKPAKDGLIKACKVLNVSQDDCIYVGDSPSDIIAAHNAGMYSIAYISNEKRAEALKATNPNKIIYDLSKIDEILKEDISWTYNTM